MLAKNNRVIIIIAEELEQLIKEIFTITYNDFPTNVQVQLTNCCDSKCVFCANSYIEQKRSIMEKSLWIHILTELKSEGFWGHINPTFCGESLLIPNIADYLRAVRRELPKATISFTTNGSKLEGHVAETILKEGLIDSLGISFNGGTKESYEKIHKGLSFDHVVNNINEFHRIRETSGLRKPELYISFVVTPDNGNTLHNIKNLFRLADRVEMRPVENWGGKYPMEVSNSKNPIRTANFCIPFEDEATILVNGNMVLCCHDYQGREVLGNVEKVSIRQVWNGERKQVVRAALSKRQFDQLPLCRHCSLLAHNTIVQILAKAARMLDRVSGSKNISWHARIIYHRLIISLKR